MTEIVTPARMREIEAEAMASGAVTGLELMERAGAGAVEAILAEWPELAEGPHRAVVLCGPGNNGGDGFVVARLLAKRGWDVDLFFYGNADRLSPDARANYERWAEIGEIGRLGFPDVDADQFRAFVSSAFGSAAAEPNGHRPPDMIVDAVFGIGLKRPLSETFGENVIGALVADGDLVPTLPDTPKIVALDVPTGFDADTGALFNYALDVHLCVTFHRAKVGHYLGFMPAAIRRLVVVDIGLPAYTVGAPTSTEADVSLVTRPKRSHGSTPPQFYAWIGKEKTPLHQFGEKPSGEYGFHKFDHGHALVVAGGVGRGGAARLAARAALRIGTGLVTVAPPPAALIENASHLEAIMLQRMPDSGALAETLMDTRISALCLGPGLGLGSREAELVRTAVASGRPCVLDADALTLIAHDPKLSDMLHAACVLTPHMGEFARLAPDLADRLTARADARSAYSKLDAARDLAARLGCTVLLKGLDTVISEPSGRAAIHSAAYGREAPWLATAGAGDVLAGMITGLIARGLVPMAACESAAWLHVECARAFGPGLIAEDLPEMLPKVLADLGA